MCEKFGSQAPFDHLTECALHWASVPMLTVVSYFPLCTVYRHTPAYVPWADAGGTGADIYIFISEFALMEAEISLLEKGNSKYSLIILIHEIIAVEIV